MSDDLAMREPGLVERARTALAIVVLRAGAIAAKFGITLFIARCLDLEALGLYGLVAGATVVVPVLAGLGIIGALGRASVDQAPREVTAALVPYWTLVAGLYLAAAAACLPLAHLHGRAGTALLVALLLLVEHLNTDVVVVLNCRRRPRLANLLLVLRSLAWIAAYVGLALAVPALRNLEAVLAFWLAGSGAALLCFARACRDWPWRSALASSPGAFLRPLRGGTRLRALVRGSRTLYLNDLANTGGQYLDRYIVGAFLGLEAAGVYFLFWSLANALGNVVNTSLLQVQLPTVIRSRGDPRRQGRLLGALRREAALASLVLAAATAVLAHLAVAVVPDPRLGGHGPVLLVLLVGFVLRMVYEVEGVGFYSRHEDRDTLLSALLVLALSLATTAALTPPLGLAGPALAVVVSYSGGWLWRWRRNRAVLSPRPLADPAPSPPASPASFPGGVGC